MDNILARLLMGTRTMANADEVAAASSMVATLAGPDHQERWTTHPLGFFHLAEEVGPGIRLRVHVWPQGWSVPDEQIGGEIHNHVFDLRSLVLFGSIRNEVFEAVENRDGEYRLLDVEYGPAISRVIPSGPAVRLEEAGYCVYTAGEVYNLRASVLHRSSAKATPAITLVLAACASVGEHPVVALAAGRQPPSAFQRRNLSSAELLLLLQAVRCLR
jgi:hypothetical protein